MSSVTLEFSRDINTNSFSPAVFQIAGPVGQVVPTGIAKVFARTYSITFPPLTENGTYQFTVLPALRDVDGYQLDQNANGIPGEAADAYTFTLILDTVPPRVTQHAPAGDVAGTVSSVDVWFSEAMDKATLVPANFSILQPSSNSIAPTSIAEVGLNRWRLSFPPQTAMGTYTVTFSTNLTDLAGNPLRTSDLGPRTFNLVPVDLRLADVTPSTNQLWANSLVTVAWTGLNASGAPLLGDWTDAVYLSMDNQWDIRDVRVATVAHTGGLASNEVYAAQASFYVPGLWPGNYHLLIRADIFNQEREATNETDNVVAYGPLPVSVPALPANGPALSGLLTTDSRAHYYAITLAAGESLLLRLQGASGVNALYASLGALPTSLTNGFAATTTSASQQIALTGPPGGGTVYVLVYGDQVGAGGNAYQLTAETGAVFVTGITPSRHGNATAALVTLATWPVFAYCTQSVATAW